MDGSACTRMAGFWPPLMVTRPTPGSWEIFWARMVSARSCTLVSGSVSEVKARVSIGRVGRIDLAVDRRVRQVARQEGAGGVDGGLHLLLRDVDVEVERELQRDERGAERAGGRHLLEAGELAELALERRGHGRRHDLGAGAGIEGEDLDGRIVHLGQRRDGS